MIIEAGAGWLGWDDRDGLAEVGRVSNGGQRSHDMLHGGLLCLSPVEVLL